MTEYIIRLTDEQEAAFRRWPINYVRHAPLFEEIRIDLAVQVKEALDLYDQLVAEAQAASDE